ncbi:MAG: VWA domain-containing protein [Deltaproteobacteria bacterium]|nr:VWA domain-containing protein [Deltaproteobacteria bacterium]
MVNIVLKFAACARGGGLRVSTSEVLDCVGQLELINFLQEPQFEAVLRTNFAKSRREQHHFDQLYHLFFHELRQDFGIFHTDGLQDRMEEFQAALIPENNAGLLDQALLDFMAGDPLAFLQEMGRIQGEGEGRRQGMGSNLGSVTRRLGVMLQLNRLQAALAQFLGDNIDRIPWEERKSLESHFTERIESARRLLLQNPKPAGENLAKIVSHEQHLSDLGETAFVSLTQKEVEELREVIKQLVRKLKDTAGLRYARQKRGVPDIKKTLRQGARYQGIPMEIIFRNRPLRKTRIVTLCDVSGSVWSAARFMLNMLYSLQECFTRVRSFVFVAGLDEVTEIFEKNEINQAIEKVLGEADIDYGAATDYGLTLRLFKKYFMDVLNKKTTLIIIGDGRSNYSNPEVEILDDMRDRCRRLIWLNPETKQFWYSGDSEMRTYEGSCHEVRPCQNLNQLLDFIKDLVL